MQEVKAASSREKTASSSCKMCIRFDAELRHLREENHDLTQALQAAERAAEQKISSSVQDALLLQARTYCRKIHTFIKVYIHAYIHTYMHTVYTH